MPWSRSTSATPAISASVFLAFSRNSTPISVRSGMMSEKSLVCLTWPAMTAWVTPARFSRSMQVPSWPSDIQWTAAGGRAARGAAATSAMSGNVSSFSAMT